MKIIIGSDHAGFDLKEKIKAHLEKLNDIQTSDLGVYNKDSADYPKIAQEAARAVADGTYNRGILICGSGVGMSIVANRYKGVRAALCHNVFVTQLSRMHNNANVLVMGERIIGWELALAMVDSFLKTPFEGERHERRLSLIDKGC